MPAGDIVFDGSPGTGAPPSTLGPYTMTAFGDDGLARSNYTTSVPAPGGGVLGFNPRVQAWDADSVSGTWTAGYTGRLYVQGTAEPLTLTLPAGTKAFYFYAEDNAWGSRTVSATVQTGATSGPIDVTTVNATPSAKYFGFYSASGATDIVTITITSSGSGGRILGEFGIARQLVPAQPQLVVDALNVRVDMGQPVPADVRVLGLIGTDSVTNVVLEYSGVDIWGKAYGPSTTPPTLAGEYDVSVKSYVLNAVDAKVYWQTKHPAKLWIRWVPLPITDGALKAPAVNADAPGAVVYGDNGATVTGTGWSLGVSGAPRASVGGFLITDPGTVFTVTGTGYRPWSPVRMFFMSDPVELGSVYADAAGAFTAKVTLPNASGSHTLQVNGYSPAGVVRSSNVALYVGTTRSLSDKFLFEKNSSELTSTMSSRIALMMNSIPVKPWRIHVTLTTSALALSGPNARLTQARVDRIASQISASLKAAGVDVVVESTIWYQPGLAPRWEKKARWVFVDLNW